jgi:oxygen-independent coproporphyrinogen-3 oxidase
MAQFVDGVRREIEGLREHHGRRVDSLFFGGGTPSLLEPTEIGSIVDRVRRLFAVDADAEITAEANPSDLTAARLVGLRAAGVNRLSVGVQSFVDRELELLGRRHDAARSARVVREARRAGFDDLSLDLMVGVPGQTAGSFAASLERAIDLAPDHLSLYLLEVHPGSGIDGLRRNRPRLFAGEEAQRRRYLLMRERLRAAGYRHYEVSNFARPGSECRHNLRYWRGGDWLGLGPSAHSSLAGRRLRHSPDLQSWLADPLRVEELDADPAVERVLTRLRLDNGVEERDLLVAGVPDAELETRLVQLTPFLTRGDGRVRLSPQGILVSNAVLAELLR